MKKCAILLLGFVLALASSAGAAKQPGEPRDFGVGAIFGSPTGLSMKYWLTDVSAVDAAMAWHFGDDDRFQIHSDYLWHITLPSLKVAEGRLPAYVGVGLRVLAGNDSEAGVRIPLGMSYLVERAPLELFAEIVPVVEFAPDTEGEIDGGVGIRFYFK
ncbi:MAG: hypothetical protein A2992_04585 [Elusimicrobia bacterium RIFCSPLOWO2_01_FULL_59_12]|nr:MAG: hypothetical protein A2992_04585 [Elusimicrobia bacterium RIFCSPLOWO2_01_FULL_59_12]